MNGLEPNAAYRALFPLPATKTAGIYRPSGATATFPDCSRQGPCDCATPCIWDLQTGQWLHLENMRPCPKRVDGWA